MKNTYTVYVHKNIKNNKLYFGITSVPIKQRWKRGSSYSKNTKIRKAIIYAQPEKLIIFLAQNSIIIKTAGASITIKSAQKLIILSFSMTDFFIFLLYQLLPPFGKFLSKQFK